MDVRLRLATPDDAERLVAFFTALSAEQLDTITRKSPPSVADQRAFVESAEAAERAFIVLALHDDQIVGLLDLWAGKAPEYHHAGKFGMSVAKAWRGRGVGRRLLERAEAQAREWPGFCRMELDVAVWNAPAIRLYERQGFLIEGRKVKSVNLRGSPEDLLMMAKTWSP